MAAEKGDDSTILDFCLSDWCWTPGHGSYHGRKKMTIPEFHNFVFRVVFG